MYYFVSDIHLGQEAGISSRQRERLFVRWLEEVSADARAIYLVGDIFDFWYEYTHVVPKGFTRVLGKLSELTDRGVEIHFFVGNHDIWAFSYLRDECGVVLHHKDEIVEMYGKRIFVAHGDNTAITEPAVRFMSWLFREKVAQWIFHILHPDLAMGFGLWWSGSSRKSKDIKHVFRGEDESLVRFSRERVKWGDLDYFVFGHTHCAERVDLGEDRAAFFLGEWFAEPTYGVLSPNGSFRLHKVEIGKDTGSNQHN